MKITVFGASGEVGSRIVAEALARGHHVDAVVRGKAQFPKLPAGATPKLGDASNAGEVAELLAGRDLAISALRPAAGHEELLVTLTRAVLDGAAAAGVRALIVGGAASLRLPDGSGHTVLTAPGFLPDTVLPIAGACYSQYLLCSFETRTDWSYLAPPAMLTPGQRRGTYRTGGGDLVVDADGASRISMEDFAVAMLDEAEQPRHARARFTVAY